MGLGPIAGAWANIVLIFLGIGLLWKADWSVLSNNSELKGAERRVGSLQET